MIDKTIETDVAKFYETELGITNQDILDGLIDFNYGNPMRDLGSLEQVRDMVLCGCYRDAKRLDGDLREYFGVGYKGEHQGDDRVIAALVAKREFKTVALDEAVARYFDHLGRYETDRFREEFGDEVPDWLFPAMVKLAHAVHSDRQSYRHVEAFGRRLAGWFENLGFGLDDFGSTLRFANLVANRGYHDFVKRSPDGSLIDDDTTE